MCASFLLVALITMCASALHPAAKVIWRMRRLLEAQIVADSVVESVRAEVEEAREYVKMDPYDGGWRRGIAPCGRVRYIYQQ